LSLEETRLFQHFLLQDQAASKNVAGSHFLPEWLRLCSDAIQITYQSLVNMPFKGDKEAAVGTLAMDAVSNVLVATRVGLWGDVPESLSILRSAIERCVQLELVIHTQRYQTAVHEMDNKFAQLDFDEAVRALGDRGKRIDKLHGLISETASHATSGRLKWNSYKRDGRTYIRFGVALDPSLAELCVFYAIDVCVSIVSAIRSAYLQDGQGYAWESEWQSIHDRYLKLNRQYRGQFENVTP